MSNLSVSGNRFAKTIFAFHIFQTSYTVCTVDRSSQLSMSINKICCQIPKSTHRLLFIELKYDISWFVIAAVGTKKKKTLLLKSVSIRKNNRKLNKSHATCQEGVHSKHWQKHSPQWLWMISICHEMTCMQQNNNNAWWCQTIKIVSKYYHSCFFVYPQNLHRLCATSTNSFPLPTGVFECWHFTFVTIQMCWTFACSQQKNKIDVSLCNGYNFKISFTYIIVISFGWYFSLRNSKRTSAFALWRTEIPIHLIRFLIIDQVSGGAV